MPFINFLDLEAEVALGTDKDAAQDIIQAMDNADIIMLVQTMCGNIDGFSKWDKVKEAIAACKA